jgi:hypothetical protein
MYIEIDYEDIKGYSKIHKIQIEIKNCLINNKALGQYIPESYKNIPLILFFREPSEQTIIHESLHATIDFFREKQNIDFNELFDNSSVFGEESFIFYHELICKKIKNALNI